MALKESLLQELKTRKSKLNEELHELSKEKDIAKVEKDRLGKQIEALSGKISEEKEEIEYLEQEIKERKETISYLEHKIRQKEEQIQKSELEIESNLSVLNNLKEEVALEAKLSNKKFRVEFEDGTFELLSATDITRSKYLESLETYQLKELSYKYPLSIAELMKLAEVARAEILEWVSKSRIPKKIYNELAIEDKPLPKSLYIDQRKGSSIAQVHITNITKDEYALMESDKKTLQDILVDHPAHMDIRILFDNSDDTSTFIVCDKDMDTLLNNISDSKEQSMIFLKDRAEYPKLSKEVVNKLTDMLITDESYWIEPGEPGATAESYSYMGLIWRGNVVTGCERPDFHELFFSREVGSESLLNGRYVLKCIEDTGWKIYRSNSKPIDSIQHSDTGTHCIHPVDNVSKFGNEIYREESKDKFITKLK